VMRIRISGSASSRRVRVLNIKLRRVYRVSPAVKATNYHFF
jgi:hypothetical protein